MQTCRKSKLACVEASSLYVIHIIQICTSLKMANHHEIFSLFCSLYLARLFQRVSLFLFSWPISQKCINKCSYVTSVRVIQKLRCQDWLFRQLSAPGGHIWERISMLWKKNSSLRLHLEYNSSYCQRSFSKTYPHVYAQSFRIQTLWKWPYTASRLNRLD